MSPQAAEPAIVNAWSTTSAVPFFRIGNYAPVFDEVAFLWGSVRDLDS